MSADPYRPGCYGSPLCYKNGHPVCTPCPLAASCAPIALARLEVLHAHFGVKKSAKKVKAVIPAPVVKVAPKLPPKPALDPKLAAIARVLRAGRNPFNSKARAQQGWWLVCEILLKRPDKAEFAFLAAVLSKQMRRDLKASIAHLSTILKELARTGALVKRGVSYAIR